MEASGSSVSRSCVSCGRPISFEANVCPYCGYDYRVQGYTALPQPAHKSMLPVVGGIFVMIAGLLAVVMGLIYFALSPNEITNSGVTLPPEITESDLQNVLYACGAMALIFGLIAIVGGAFGITRKHFSLGIVGGIFGLLGFGFGIGSLLALIGIILIGVARKEFM